MSRVEDEETIRFEEENPIARGVCLKSKSLKVVRDRYSIIY